MRHLYIMLGIVMMAACSSKTSTEEAAKAADGNTVTLSEAQKKNANIVTDTISGKNISSLIKLNGKIDVPPQNMVSISMPLGGYLESTTLLPGKHVSRGENIAKMEDGQYIQLQQDYLTAKSKLAYTEAEYNRQKELNADKTSSDKVFQQSTMDYETQKVMVNALAQKLELININPATLTASNISRSISIHSPIDGYVSKVNVNIGKYVNPSDILFELVNPTDIHLNLVVFEKDIPKLFIGQKLMAYNNLNPSQKFPCEIILISKDVSPEGTSEVHCHFEKYDRNLLPGMYMNAEVDVKVNNVAALPEEAIVNYQGKSYVFTDAGNNKYSMQAVETGTKEGGFIEIINAGGLSGKQIVIKGAYTLLMAAKNKSDE